MHLKTRTAYAAWDHTVEFEGGVSVRLLPPTEAALRDAAPASRAELIDAAQGLVPPGARPIVEAQSAAALVQCIQFYETLAAEWRAAQARGIAAAAVRERLTTETQRARRKTEDGGMGSRQDAGRAPRRTTLESWREQVGGRRQGGGRKAEGEEEPGGNPPAMKLARELAAKAG